MSKVLPVSLLAILLLGCATPQPIPVQQRICVPDRYLRAYTNDEKQQAKREMELIGPDSEIGRMLIDYAMLQRAAQACAAGR